MSVDQLIRAEAMLRRSLATIGSGFEDGPGAPLSFHQWRTLRLVFECKDLSISDIAREVGMIGSTATRLVDQLEKRRLVERHRQSADRRVVALSLTPVGLRLLALAEAFHTRFWQQRVGGVDDQHLRIFFEILDRIQGPETDSFIHER